MARKERTDTAADGSASDGRALATFKDLATIVPIVHVLTTCCYLFGYGRGFGRQIVAFMTLNDLFTASLRAVGLAYLLVAIPVLLFVLLRALEGRQGRLIPLYLAFLVTLVAVIAFALAAPSSALAGRDLYVVASFAAMAALLIATFALLKLMRKAGAAAESMAILATGMLFAFALALGYNKGAMDRGRTHDGSAGRYFQCDGGMRVIRSVGDHYLTIDSNDRWALVDGECRPRFHLEAPAQPGR